MSRKHKKAKKIVSLTETNKSVRVAPEILQKLTPSFEIEFFPVVIDPETGHFENVDLFKELLPAMEEFSEVFGDDSTPKKENYSDWLKFQIECVRNVSPWIFIVLVDGKAEGCLWAVNWEGMGSNPHAVDISGFCKRKTPLSHTMQAVRKFLSLIFESTQVYIIRARFDEGNRAASWAVGRCGLTHTERQRASTLKESKEITSIIKSITRPEWEAQKNVWTQH